MDAEKERRKENLCLYPQAAEKGRLLNLRFSRTSLGHRPFQNTIQIGLGLRCQLPVNQECMVQRSAYLYSRPLILDQKPAGAVEEKGRNIWYSRWRRLPFFWQRGLQIRQDFCEWQYLPEAGSNNFYNPDKNTSALPDTGERCIPAGFPVQEQGKYLVGERPGNRYGNGTLIGQV